MSVTQRLVADVILPLHKRPQVPGADLGEHCARRVEHDHLALAVPGFTLRTYTHLMPSAHDRMREAIDASRAQDHGPTASQGGAK
jgi:hypothetical protein